MGSLFGSAGFTILVTFAIVGVLLEESRRFFLLPGASFSEFFLSGRWNPLLGGDKHFGVWPLVCGTGLVTLVAACVALPFGLMTAVYLSEYAPRRARATLKPLLEILAGIPTVVYGYFALTFITPQIIGLQGRVNGFSETFEWLPGWLHGVVFREVDSYNALSAGLAIGIMTLPIVCSLSEDALQAVPRSLREGAFAVGGTRFDVSVKVVVPAALSGIVASYLLAIARAVGETMIVALAAGGLAQLTADPRNQVQTMTGWMAQILFGDAAAGGMEYHSTYAVGATLFFITLLLTIVGQVVLARYREEYT
ncbi:MAG: phosphate ABC transporter permease subunit PstC [Phycisphaerales bacterium]